MGCRSTLQWIVVPASWMLTFPGSRSVGVRQGKEGGVFFMDSDLRDGNH